MENDEITRLAGEGQSESYWLSRKKQRDEKAREEDEQALGILKLACKFYKETYPESAVGIDYNDSKEDLPKASFEVGREDALKFRTVLEYFKSEQKLTMVNKAAIGRAVWRVNQCIPDISRLNQIIQLEKDKHDIDREIHRLKTMKEELAKTPEIEEKNFTCNYCKKKFDGPTARSDIQAHISVCKERPDKEITTIEEPEVKLFTCQVCGIKLDRFDMKDHARRCKKVEKPKVVIEKPKETIKETSGFVCEVCDKVCANKGALTNHMKTHKDE